MTSTTPIVPSGAFVHAHIAWWFALCTGEIIAGTRLNPNETQFFTDPAQAAAWAVTASIASQVYIRQTTLSRLPEGPKQRGSDELTLSMPGLWFDIDIADAGHKTDKKLPETLEVALELIGHLPPPSAIVHSGGGLYALYRFSEPLRATTAPISAMAELSNDAQLALQRIWSGSGDYHMDNLGDMSRILRPAGSLNHKLEQPRPVTWLVSPEDGAGDYRAETIVDTLTSIASQYPNPAPAPQSATNNVIRLPDRPVMKGGQHSIIDTFHQYTTLSEVLSEDSEVWHLCSPDRRWERWKRADSTAEYSIKMDTSTGVVIVWSDTVASRWGLASDQRGHTLWQIMAAIHGQDAHRLATASLSAARAASPLPINSRSLDRAYQTIADAMALEAPASSNGSSQLAATPPAPPAGLNLPDEFWEARAALRHIRDAAYNRLVAPDAVLNAVFARVAASTGPAFRLPPIVGHECSLCFYSLIVGPSGSGKSSAMGIASELVPISRPEVAEPGQLGSGEGLIEAYLEFVTEDVGDGKTQRVKKKTKMGAYVTLDEGTALAEMGGRSGSTLLSILRSMWTGGLVGQANASEETKRKLEGGTYNLGFVMGLQPSKSADLLSDGAAGTPQRFCWLSSTDPKIMNYIDDYGEFPGRLAWSPVAGSRDQQKLTFDPSIAREIRMNTGQRNSGIVTSDELDSHHDLGRMKVAALLAILDGRLNVMTDDWHLAGIVTETSRRVRQHSVDTVRQAVKDEAASRDERAAARAVRVEDALTEVKVKALDMACRSAWREVSQAGAEGSTEGAMWRVVGGRVRPDVERDVWLKELLALAWIAPHPTDRKRFICGSSRPDDDR